MSTVSGLKRAPLADLEHFPELVLGELLEERQRARHAEALGVGLAFLLLRAMRLLPDLGERGSELVPARVAVLPVLRDRLHHDAFELRRDALAVLARRVRLGIHDLVDHAHGVRARERQAPREQVVHDDAERVDVGDVRGLLVARDQLRRHERGGADVRDDRLVRDAVDRRAEVGELDLGSVVVEDVAGLDVAVREAQRVREGERAHALEDDLDHVVRGQERVGLAELLQRPALTYSITM
jgi:hypothetical protein